MSQQLSTILPILSLVIAILAVFVGPLISIYISKRQSEANLRAAKKSIVSPIRQAWINELRNILSELVGKTAHYWSAGYEERTDEEYLKIKVLISKLDLYLNPNKPDHIKLMNYITLMENALSAGESDQEVSEFWQNHTAAVRQAQIILKTEWERVKNEI